MVQYPEVWVLNRILPFDPCWKMSVLYEEKGARHCAKKTNKNKWDYVLKLKYKCQEQQEFLLLFIVCHCFIDDKVSVY